MIELHHPKNEIELSLLKGILEGEGIRYFVKNDTFGSMKVGPRIPHYNEKCILVEEEDFDRAKEILAHFIKTAGEDEPRITYSLGDKIRMVIETLFFGWIMPGRSRSRSKKKTET